MTVYLLRRSAFLLVSFLIAMVAIFVLLRLLPGDPSNALLSATSTPEQIAAAQAQVGADRPVLEQFVTWFAQLASFDLGESFISTLPVGPEIAADAASVWLYLYPQIVVASSDVSGYPVNGLNSQFYVYDIVVE